MRRQRKTTIGIKYVLRDNEGASIVMVSIIALIIVTGVIVLRITTSSLWASADKQYNQDQAYVAATSLGEAIDGLLVEGYLPPSSIDGLPVSFNQVGDSDYYILEVTASYGDASYTYSTNYKKAGTSYRRVY